MDVQRLCAGYRILDDAGDRNNIQRAVSCRVANGVFTRVLYIFSAVAILILEETAAQHQLDRLKILFVCGIGKLIAVDLCDIPCAIRCLCIQDKRVIQCHIAWEQVCAIRDLFVIAVQIPCKAVGLRCR